MAKLSPREIAERTREIEPIRKLAFELWEKDSKINSTELCRLLKQHGHDVKKGTCSTWLSRWRGGKGYAKSTEPKREALAPAPAPPPALTWEDIIKAVPDIETLSILTFQGLMKCLEEKDVAYDTLKQENIRLQQEISDLKQEKNQITRKYNELLAEKGIHTTLKQAQDTIFGKKKGKGR